MGRSEGVGTGHSEEEQEPVERNDTVSSASRRRPSTHMGNLMAAWLLREMSDIGRFGELTRERRMRALESALFMVGYELPLGETRSPGN
jgi:hypothetical protein